MVQVICHWGVWSGFLSTDTPGKVNHLKDVFRELSAGDFYQQTTMIISHVFLWRYISRFLE